MTRPTAKKALLTRRGIDREVLVDKLAERWLFARTMIDLYDAVLPRVRSAGERTAGLDHRFGGFRRTERLHASMLEALLRLLGREPQPGMTTPSIDIAATEAASLLDLCTAPGVGLPQLLEVLLSAELIDGAGWWLLGEMGRVADLDDEWLGSLRAAGREVEEHVHVLRAWLDKVELEALSGPRVT